MRAPDKSRVFFIALDYKRHDAGFMPGNQGGYNPDNVSPLHYNQLDFEPSMNYFDYAATTPLDPRVSEVMQPYFSETFGNPSSIHRYGQKAEAAVDFARETVASVLGCQPDEIVFTSCGTESDNLALRGAALAAHEKSGANWIITSRAEHHAVSKTAQQLEKYYGFQVEWLEVDADGMITPEAVERAVCDETAVVSVMYANNEIGTVNPIREISAICRQHGVAFHTDAVQAAAYLSTNVKTDRRGSHGAGGAQILRSEGRRGTLRSQGNGTCSIPNRRRTREQPTSRNAECALHCGLC